MSLVFINEKDDSVIWQITIPVVSQAFVIMAIKLNRYTVVWVLGGFLSAVASTHIAVLLAPCRLFELHYASYAICLHHVLLVVHPQDHSVSQLVSSLGDQSIWHILGTKSQIPALDIQLFWPWSCTHAVSTLRCYHRILRWFGSLLFGCLFRSH